MSRAPAPEEAAGPDLPPPDTDYRFVAPHRGRTAAAVVAVACLLGGAGALAMSVHRHSGAWGIAAAGLVVLAVACWTSLVNHIPQTVTIHNSLVTITRSGHTESLDLVDPNVEIMMRDGLMEFRYYARTIAVLSPRDVPWQRFVAVVTHYQGYADRLAQDRTRRFGH